ncbi:MAG: signal peptidase I [Clostridiales bacterium]|nr:signal peptidase I [Clostridiales bacterium]
MEREPNTVEKEETARGKTIGREIFSWCRTILAALLIAFLLTQFVIVNATVPTGSMMDTIQKKDRLIGLRFAYWFGDPKRGDIVIFDAVDFPDEHLLKRVIGLPGETVEGRDGRVYIDGQPLEEPYAREAIQEDFGPFQVPADSYFMMGDNRNDSLDSRFWEHPYVPKKDILGKAVLRYWPGISLFHGPSYDE